MLAEREILDWSIDQMKTMLTCIDAKVANHSIRVTGWCLCQRHHQQKVAVPQRTLVHRLRVRRQRRRPRYVTDLRKTKQRQRHNPSEEVKSANFCQS